MSHDPGVERLEKLASRVRALAATSRPFHEALNASVAAMHDWIDSNRRDEADNDARERSIVRKMLTKGRFFKRRRKSSTYTRWVSWEGLCPTQLVPDLSRFDSSNLPPPSKERRFAAWALKALDRHVKYQDLALPVSRRAAMATQYRRALRSGRMKSVRWEVVIARPNGMANPINPYTLDTGELRQLTDAQYRTAALFQLGGLADVGVARPIVPKPGDTGDGIRDIGMYCVWRARHPSEWDSNSDCPFGPPNPAVLPPKVAEQMFEHVSRLPEFRKSRTAKPTQPMKPPAQSTPPVSESNEVRVAEDFTWIVWYGQEYHFSKGLQQESMRCLYTNWEMSGKRSGLGLSELTIAEKTGSGSTKFRLAHVFRGHKCWGKLIRKSGSGKGTFALFAPESQKNHTA